MKIHLHKTYLGLKTGLVKDTFVLRMIRELGFKAPLSEEQICLVIEEVKKKAHENGHDYE